MIQTAFTLEQKQRAFEELKAIKQFAADRGWFPATSGNLSVKLPLPLFLPLRMRGFTLL